VMRISEFIEALEGIKLEHGDIPVTLMEPSLSLWHEMYDEAQDLLPAGVEVVACSVGRYDSYCPYGKNRDIKVVQVGEEY